MMAEKMKSPKMAPGEKATTLKPPTSEKEAMERAIKRMQAREAAKKESVKPKKMGGGSLSYGKMKMAGGGMVDDMKAAGFKMAEGGKMPMDPKTGKPTFVGDGKGKMGHGGMAYGKKKMMGGGMAYGKNKMMDGGSMARGSGAARPQKFGKNG
jgi:hypothetical protein